MIGELVFPVLGELVLPVLLGKLVLPVLLGELVIPVLLKLVFHEPAWEISRFPRVDNYCFPCWRTSVSVLGELLFLYLEN